MISKTHQVYPITRSRNISNKITSTNIRLLMLNEINNWQYVGLIILTYNTKYNTDRMFLLRDRKKVSVSILFQKTVCLGWKLSPIINRQGGGRGVLE